MSARPILEIEGLSVDVLRDKRRDTVVEGVSFTVGEQRCLGVVGESGSGKSLTLRSVIDLLPARAEVSAGSFRLAAGGGAPVPFEPAKARGHDIAMIFQEPRAALNPLRRVGDLIAEAVRNNRAVNRKGAKRRAIELMNEVGIPDPERRYRSWPHELSGGQQQRVLISMSLACEPRLLLCDEPTTALDATVQRQILALLNRIRRERELSIIFVSHDLPVVYEMADELAVMYAGAIVEQGPVGQVVADPHHPYTHGLVAAAAPPDKSSGRFPVISGTPPDVGSYPEGCRFHPRCPYATDACRKLRPQLRKAGGDSENACLRAEQLDFSQPLGIS